MLRAWEGERPLPGPVAVALEDLEAFLREARLKGRLWKRDSRARLRGEGKVTRLQLARLVCGILVKHEVLKGAK